MKVIAGIVSRVRSTAEVSGNQHGVGTSQILSFRIGSQAVELNLSSLPQVEEGDRVAVAGDVVNGVLIARAYRNFDTNAYGRKYHDVWPVAVPAVVFGLPLFLLAAAVLRNGDSSVLGLLGWFLVICSPFFFMTAARLAAAIRTAEASRLVWSVDD